jgi:hypothetical protein
VLEEVCERGILCRQSQVVLFGYIGNTRIYRGNIISPPLTHQHSVFRVPQAQALVFPNRGYLANLGSVRGWGQGLKLRVYWGPQSESGRDLRTGLQREAGAASATWHVVAISKGDLRECVEVWSS